MSQATFATSNKLLRPKSGNFQKKGSRMFHHEFSDNDFTRNMMHTNQSSLVNLQLFPSQQEIR